jgi:hypothetical protein
MEPYKGYFIEGDAMLVHPYSPDWYVGGSVLVSGRSSSVVEIGRFQFQRFTVSIKELAEWWRLPGSWWTNACRSDRAEWRSTSNAPVPSVTAIWESAPRTKGQLCVQAINGRCLKCGYRLPSLAIREKRRQRELCQISATQLCKYVDGSSRNFSEPVPASAHSLIVCVEMLPCTPDV